MPRDPGGDDEPIPFPAVGPVRRRLYERNPKHAAVARGRIAREPRNGQESLDFSVLVKPSSPTRVGIDYDDGVFVVFHWHGSGEFHDALNHEIFHGYVIEWRDLMQDQRNALMKAGMANLRGRIT